MTGPAATIIAHEPRKPKCDQCGAVIDGSSFYSVTRMSAAVLGVPGDYMPSYVAICGSECLKAWAESQGSRS